MRARYTRSIGLPVLDEDAGEIVGTISGILLHPDTGTVEGFFIRGPGLFPRNDLFLFSNDILHWGLRVTIRSAEVLSPMEDLIRLQSLLAGERPVLGQRMVTEGGRALGRCADVQFSTKDFRLEWLFPRRFWRNSIPVPASQIIEVRSDGIILREGTVPESKEESVSLIPQLPETV